MCVHRDSSNIFPLSNRGFQSYSAPSITQSEEGKKVKQGSKLKSKKSVALMSLCMLNYDLV